MNKDLLDERSVMFNREFTFEKKSKGIAFLLWLFLGVFGAQRYYVGDIGIGLAMTLTGGGGGIWFLIDAFFIAKRVEAKNRELELKREKDIWIWKQKRGQEIRLQNQRREQEKEHAIRLQNQKREQEIRLQNQLREQRIRRSGIHEVDEMSGEAFEEFLQTLLKARGYMVNLTPTSGDYGADLILSTSSKKIAVQAKRYNSKVGLSAVQEIVSAKSYYHADECWVITNNHFTAQAVNLASSNGVILVDRDKLIEWMVEETKNVENDLVSSGL
ncbi:restriction endonuclease [Sporosarcina sp. ACRSL]|uniref:restriction endonuclease n=1 Tax=Sporosarcina sp. ACRSL TaxID=2918215 RepID=UPI001EF631AC|nr:restriction endonuclease [Sporosarcina sp. ACRSL]MCG7344806.1 restriction endonuclease [Sporosarcina sp. ACRSL]